MNLSNDNIFIIILIMVMAYLSLQKAIQTIQKNNRLNRVEKKVEFLREFFKRNMDFLKSSNECLLEKQIKQPDIEIFVQDCIIEFKNSKELRHALSMFITDLENEMSVLRIKYGQECLSKDVEYDLVEVRRLLMKLLVEKGEKWAKE